MCSCHADFSALEKFPVKAFRRTLLIYLYVNAAFWMMNTGIYDSWVSRYALYVCVICFYASGYKEKFPHRDNKDELKSRGSERRKEQQLWAFSFLLRVPSGVFTVNKQRSGFHTKTRCPSFMKNKRAESTDETFKKEVLCYEILKTLSWFAATVFSFSAQTVKQYSLR